ncbi:hypothetical protein H4R34_003094 [Dimargaris verticillata]|uniref:Uncharacterized protein n=1 Tax=Dimargaris verticillata TaxID=2761393 RepID=A0A9W8B2U2_9FUNG|nr:hypothetical protein H4R34_003094 [Dimargaris verticillata]
MSKQTKQRPSGLKRAHRAAPAEGTQPKLAKHAPANTLTSAAHEDSEEQMSIALNDPEDADEVGDLMQIYETAFDTVKTDSDRAVTLFRGVVHESDRLLRVWSETDKPLPPQFHWIYGMALFFLSELNEDDDSLAFLELAAERFGRGLEACDALAQAQIANGTSKRAEMWAEALRYEAQLADQLQLTDIRHRLMTSQAKAQVSQARILACQDERSTKEQRQTLITQAVASFDTVVRANFERHERAILETILVQQVSLIHTYVNFVSDWAEIRQLNEAAIDKLRKALDEGQDNPKLWCSVGYCYWSMAKYYLDQDDGEADSDTDDSDAANPVQEELLQKARPYLEQALVYLVKARDLFDETHPEMVLLLLTLGEVQVNLGNCLDDDGGDDDNNVPQPPGGMARVSGNKAPQLALDDTQVQGKSQTDFYRAAVTSFKRASSIGGDEYTLSEQLEAFLQEWEEEMEA